MADVDTLVGFYFFPRGGSAHATRAICEQLGANGFEVTLLAGSRTDRGPSPDALDFFAGIDVRAVDFSPALASVSPEDFAGPAGTAPMQGSYEDRDGARDLIFTDLDDADYEAHVSAWARELLGAGAESARLLYLSHLTPIHEAALRELPDTPIVTHIHGSELLMLEQIRSGELDAPDAASWLERMRRWAQASDALVVNSPEGLERAAELLGAEPGRFLLEPNGYGSEFGVREIDREAHWRRHLVDQPQGWRPGEPAGSVSYRPEDLEALAGPTLIATGRFTSVKRLPLLVETFARIAPQFEERTALVLLGGYPREWEREHPQDTIERLGAHDVFLAGWHGHDDLPDFFAASDLIVHASVREQFGQVLVEAAACGLPAIAVDRGGPADIVEEGSTGWLVEPDDTEGLGRAMLEAVNDPTERRRRGELARRRAEELYSWEHIGSDLAERLHGVLERRFRPVLGVR